MALITIFRRSGSSTNIHKIIRSSYSQFSSISPSNESSAFTIKNFIPQLDENIESIHKEKCKRNGSQSVNIQKNSLLRVIESELARLTSTHQETKIPHEFPFKEDQHDVHDGFDLSLTRVYKDQVIKLGLYYNGEDEDEDEDEDQYEDEDDGNEDSDGNDDDNKAVVDLNVQVINVRLLDEFISFECELGPDNDIRIESITVGEEGTRFNFEDLNESLQKELYKYLERREIKPSTTSVLYDYMRNRPTEANQNYLSFLQELKKFL